MSATTAPAVKAKLVSLFAAAVESETQVWFNRTNEEHRFDENVYVGDVSGRREWSSIGPGAFPVQENYAVMVTVEVYRDGTDAEGTENRAWTIAKQLEEALKDPSLSKQEKVQWALIENFESKSVGGTNGWTCAVVLDVAITARI